MRPGTGADKTNASLALLCRKTMEIRTKHVKAGSEPGLEGLQAVEIGAKQLTKRRSFVHPKRKKKQARKNVDLPSLRFRWSWT